MDVYRYRSKARLVAIIDLILSSMSLCMCLILLLGAVMLSADRGIPINGENDDALQGELGKQHPDMSNRKVFVTFMWILVVFTSITTIIQIMAAIKLLNATQLGKEPPGALKLCVFWRHVCVVFTILLMLSTIFSRLDGTTSIFQLIQIILRASAIYVVTKFMRELENAIATGVLPMHCQPGATPIIAGVAYAYIPSQHQQPPYNPEMNAAPPSYHEVVKEPPPLKQ